MHSFFKGTNSTASTKAIPTLLTILHSISDEGIVLFNFWQGCQLGAGWNSVYPLTSMTGLSHLIRTTVFIHLFY